jgi:hypothetical protein
LFSSHWSSDMPVTKARMQSWNAASLRPYAVLRIMPRDGVVVPGLRGVGFALGGAAGVRVAPKVEIALGPVGGRAGAVCLTHTIRARSISSTR